MLPVPPAATGLVLRTCAGGGLELGERAHPERDGLRVDFAIGATARRRAGIRRSTHPLARAVGRKRPLPEVVDGTAGLGRDAFVLACLGYRVRAWERSPVLHALLADGLARLAATADPVTDLLSVHFGDVRDELAHLRPAVVYLDPMFPGRRKSALVKKDMQILHRLFTAGGSALDADETDARALVAAALAAATQRVVVKRPARAPALAGGVDFRVPGNTVRWDVYLRG